MSQNSNDNWTSMLKKLASENLPTWRHSTSKYFGEFQIRTYPDLFIENRKTRQFARSGISFRLKWTVFLLLQTTLIQSVCCQGDKLGYNVDKRHGESIFNSSKETTTSSWLQFMEQDAKETIEDWEKVLKMNKPRLLGTEVNLNNRQLEETKMSWMPFMEIERESPEIHPFLKRLRRDLEAINMDTATEDVTSSATDTTTAHVTSSGIDNTTEDKTGSGMNTTATDVTSSGIDTTTADITSSEIHTTTAYVTSYGIYTTTEDETGSGMNSTATNVTSSGIDTTTADVTTSGIHTTTAHVTSYGSYTTTEDETGSGMNTTATDVTSSGIDTTTADVTTSGIHTTTAHVTSSGIDATTEDETGSGMNTTATDVTSSGIDTITADVTTSGIHTTTAHVTSYAIYTTTEDETGSGMNTTATDVTSSGIDTTTADVTTSGIHTITAHVTSSGIDATTEDETGSGMNTTATDVTSSGIDTTATNVTSSGINTITMYVTGSGIDITTVDVTSSGIETTTAHVTGSRMYTTAMDVTTTVYEAVTSGSIETTVGGSGTEETTEMTSGPEPTTAQPTQSQETTATEPTTTQPTQSQETTTTEPITAQTTQGQGTATAEPTMSQTIKVQETTTAEPTTAQTTQGQETATTKPNTAQTTKGQEITTTAIMYTASTAGSVCDLCNSTNQYCVESLSTDRCECVPGYTLQQNNCERAKQFGGKLHMDVIFIVELEDSTSSIYKSAEVNYTEFLETAYGDQDWFISVQIIGFSSGSTIVEYELTTKNSDAVNSASVQTAFQMFLEDDTYFSTCNCNATACTPKDLKVDFPVMAQESCADAGTATETLCKSPDIISYCDSNTTICAASEDGTVQCQCTNQDYTMDTETNRSCIAVSCLTSANYGCNEPFGNCVSSNSKVRCECMWGFQGTNCQQAWLFILVIVLSGLILIAIIVGAVIVCRRRHKAKGWNTADGGTYYNETLPELDRYKTLSEWDQQIGGIVPTSYKRVGDSEPYDDMILENDYASGNDSGDHKEPIDKQLPLQRWRVREIGYGNGVQYEEAHNNLGEREGNTGRVSTDSSLTMEQTSF